MYDSNLEPNEYCNGTRRQKYDTVDSLCYCSDVVVADLNGNWTLNLLVVKGVAQNTLTQQNSYYHQSGSRISTRASPCSRWYWALSNTLGTNFPSCLCQVSTTYNYFWINI